MANAYDLLTGIQLCMILVFLVVAFQFWTHQHFSVILAASMPLLYVIWGAALIYYFSSFLYLTLLWTLLGLLVGIVISVYFRSRFPKLLYYPHEHIVACTGAKAISFFFFATIFAACCLQIFLYNSFDSVYYWVFNEGLGLGIGAFIGLFLGGAGTMAVHSEWIEQEKISAPSSV